MSLVTSLRLPLTSRSARPTFDRFFRQHWLITRGGIPIPSFLRAPDRLRWALLDVFNSTLHEDGEILISLPSVMQRWRLRLRHELYVILTDRQLTGQTFHDCGDKISIRWRLLGRGENVFASIYPAYNGSWPLALGCRLHAQHNAAHFSALALRLLHSFRWCAAMELSS